MGSPINTKEKHGNITKPQISNYSYTLWWFSWHTSLNLRTCPWACCRFVLQGCLHSPELCRSNAFFCGCFTTIDCFPCIIIKAYHGISYQILHGQFFILPPCSFYVVVSVCSLGSFRTKKQQFAWIRTARSTPWRDGGNVVLGLGNRPRIDSRSITILK